MHNLSLFKYALFLNRFNPDSLPEHQSKLVVPISLENDNQNKALGDLKNKQTNSNARPDTMEFGAKRTWRSTFYLVGIVSWTILAL